MTSSSPPIAGRKLVNLCLSKQHLVYISGKIMNEMGRYERMIYFA
jgi:hypothetical protein